MDRTSPCCGRTGRGTSDWPGRPACTPRPRRSVPPIGRRRTACSSARAQRRRPTGRRTIAVARSPSCERGAHALRYRRRTRLAGHRAHLDQGRGEHRPPADAPLDLDVERTAAPTRHPAGAGHDVAEAGRRVPLDLRPSSASGRTRRRDRRSRRAPSATTCRWRRRCMRGSARCASRAARRSRRSGRGTCGGSSPLPPYVPATSRARSESSVAR